MLNSRFNVYNTEWLDLVFANRNQSYGAYELRRDYERTLAKALFFASFLFVAGICSPMIYSRFAEENNIPVDPTVTNPLTKEVVVVLPPKKPLVQPAEAASGPKVNASSPKVKTIRYIEPRVVPSEKVTDDIPKISDLAEAVISPSSESGTASAINAPSITEGNGGSGQSRGGNADNNEIISVALIEKYPEFPGGMEAFAKYLQRNLRYPTAASEQGIVGRVTLSFIVEKDGRLTDIKVLRGIGFGCDEEAVRVLKKSPDWSAGMQNNQKVRVQYTLPIVFNME